VKTTCLQYLSEFTNRERNHNLLIPGQHGRNRRMATIQVIACWGVGICLVGCWGGNDGPGRFRVSGTVQYQDRPVPSGYVMFEPDASVGNQGPGAIAAIHQGRFITPPGKGVVGGPHTVKVVGYPPVEESSAANSVPPSPLFPTYVTTVDFSREQDTEMELVVPVHGK